MGYKRRVGSMRVCTLAIEPVTIMRVIAGTWRGRRLAAVPGHGTRPTADRVREAIFSRLESRYTLAGAHVLDLYAGTGALGIEALSRGAVSLISVERNRRAAAVLAENLGACRAGNAAEVRVEEVDRALVRLCEAGAHFDGVFIDPPYGDELLGATLALLGESGLVCAGGWVIAETARDEPLPGAAGSLSQVRADMYGDTKITLYECNPSGG